MPLSKGDALLNQAIKGKVDAVQKSLVSLGLNVDFQDEKGVSALHTAAHYKRLNVVILLMDHGANVNIACHKKWTALHLVSFKGYVAIAQVLLDNGANVHCLDVRRSSALHYAAEYQKVEMAKLLLTHGAKSDIQDEDGMTPFHYACKEGSLEVVKLLCDAGINVNQTNNSRETGLHLTIQKKATDIVKELIARSANIELKDEDLETPLHCACAVGDAAIVNLLCTAGATVDPVNEIKETPLHLACRCHKSDAANVLLKFGANVESRDENNSTPLHIACEYGKSNCVQLLLDKGANSNALDAQKRMPRSTVKKISTMLEQRRLEVRKSTIATAVSIANSINQSFAVKEESGRFHFNNAVRPRIAPSESKVIDLDFYDDDEEDNTNNNAGEDQIANTDNPPNVEESKHGDVDDDEAINDSLSTDSEQTYEPLQSEDSSCDDPGERKSRKKLIQSNLGQHSNPTPPLPTLSDTNQPSPNVAEECPSSSRQSNTDHSESNTTVSSVPTNALVVLSTRHQRVQHATNHNAIVLHGRNRSLPTHGDNADSSRQNTIRGRMRKLAWTLEIRMHPAQSMLEQVTVMERLVHGEPQRGRLFDRVALLEKELGFGDNI
jgi:ankyrin repeat protein